MYGATAKSRNFFQFQDPKQLHAGASRNDLLIAEVVGFQPLDEGKLGAIILPNSKRFFIDHSEGRREDQVKQKDVVVYPAETCIQLRIAFSFN